LPTDWEDLERLVADVLEKAGLDVEHKKIIQTVRGQVEIDVYGIQRINERQFVLFCECKHWKARVPQTIVHAFRSVVQDAGANAGYIISSEGFQEGAITAAANSPIKLVNWQEFQLEFEADYFQNYFRAKLQEYVDGIVTFVEPLSPGFFLASGRLVDEDVNEFLRLKEKYVDFAFTCLAFFPYMEQFRQGESRLRLPIRQFQERTPINIPEHIAIIDDYESFLEAARQFVEEGVREFRAVLKERGST
jgi:hypothetical protein